MTERTPRSRRARAGTTPQNSTDAAPRASAGIRGDAGYQRAKQQSEQQAAKRAAKGGNNVWRYSLDPDGTEHEIVILDAKMEEVFYLHEHETWDPVDRERIYTPCLCDTGDCPLCDEAEKTAGQKDAKFKSSYYVMLLTILDLKPYTLKKGDRAGQVITQKKKLLAVKSSQLDSIASVLRIVEENHGTIRGTILRMKRSQKIEARHGSIQPNPETAKVYEWVDEDYLEEYFGHDAVVSNGKEIKSENDDLIVYNYDELFPMPTPSSIRTLWGLAPTEGSDAANQEEFAGSDDQASSGRTRQRTRARSSNTNESSPPPRGRGSRQRTSPTPSADLDDEIPF